MKQFPGSPDPVMWFFRRPRLARIRKDLDSDDSGLRAAALQALLFRVARDPANHEWALPLFRGLLTPPGDPLTATRAVQGLELLSMHQEARSAWLLLLEHQEERFAVWAAGEIHDPSWFSTMVDLLDKRPEPGFRMAALASLGRMQHPRSLPVLLPWLENGITRAVTIQALERLENPEAIPALKPMLQDYRDSGVQDERGCPLTVSDLASSAVRRLEYLARLR